LCEIEQENKPIPSPELSHLRMKTRITGARLQQPVRGASVPMDPALVVAELLIDDAGS
jgi:hypothetical protein